VRVVLCVSGWARDYSVWAVGAFLYVLIFACLDMLGVCFEDMIFGFVGRVAGYLLVRVWGGGSVFWVWAIWRCIVLCFV